MALKLNGRIVFFNNPGSYQGVQSLQSGNFIKGGLRNRNAGGFERIFSGYPNGNLAPSSFILPDNDGSISSYTRANETISKLDANLIPARPMIATSSMVIAVTDAQLDQIVSAVANGTLTIQKLDAILAGAAALSANGTLNLTSNASSGAIFSVTADSAGQISVNVTLTALAFMDAESGGPTPLSPEGLAKAVWDENIADHLSAGSTGKALSDAGSAGNPWSTPLSGNNTAGTFGGFVQKLLTVSKFLGLK